MSGLFAVFAVLAVLGDGEARQRPPTLNFVAGSEEIVVGTKLELECKANAGYANLPITFTWILEGTNVRQTHTPTNPNNKVDVYARNKVTSQDTGRYVCEVTFVNAGTPPTTSTLTSNYKDVTVKNVVFHAFKTKVEGSVIIFHEIVTNTGDAYNINTGEFTAPIDGNYYFKVNLYIRCKNNNRQVAWIIHNQEKLVWIMCDDSNHLYHPLANSIILQLKKEEKVYIGYQTGRSFLWHGHTHSSFSAHFIDF